jgi:hypothetical protein
MFIFNNGLWTKQQINLRVPVAYSQLRSDLATISSYACHHKTNVATALLSHNTAEIHRLAAECEKEILELANSNKRRVQQANDENKPKVVEGAIKTKRKKSLTSNSVCVVKNTLQNAVRSMNLKPDSECKKNKVG